MKIDNKQQVRQIITQHQQRLFLLIVAMLTIFIIMYRFKISRDQQQATLFTYSANKSLVIVKAARLQVTHQILAQSRLLLQFNIHENHEDISNWPALQHKLKQKFDDVIAGQLLPFCNLKVHIYILNTESHIESAITNAVWACLLMHGVPMKRSIFHYEWKNKEEKGECVLDLNSPTRIISSESNCIVPPQAASECHKFKKQLTQFLSKQWSR